MKILSFSSTPGLAQGRSSELQAASTLGRERGELDAEFRFDVRASRTILPSPQPNIQVMDSPRKRQKLAMAGFDGASDLPDRDAAIEASREADKAPPTPQSEADNKTAVAQAMKETEVGITEYVNADLTGFSGIVKKRYSDFLVNEILPSGEVLHLQSLQVPKLMRPRQNAHVERSVTQGTQTQADAVEQKENSTAEARGKGDPPQEHEELQESRDEPEEGSPKSKFDPSGEDEALLESYFGKGTVKEVIELHRRIIRSPHAKSRDLGHVVTDVITDRLLRTKIHEALRRIFASRLESFTNADGAMDISAAPPRSYQGNNTNRGWSRSQGGTTANQNPNPARVKLGWHELGGEYLHFSIYKENKDTMEVISFIARYLKLNVKLFHFAGTKDRRGVTVQRASVHRLYADRLAACNRQLRGTSLGDYKYEKDKLSLGDSEGNEFVITLRECVLPNGDSSIEGISSAVTSSIENFRLNGFINYYGLQRFGTFTTRTDTVGVHMLKGDFKAACDAILHYDPGDLPCNQDLSAGRNDRSTYETQSRADAIRIFQTTNKTRDALNMLPRKFATEYNVMKHLGHPDNSNDFYGALQMVQRNMRLMYVHAYQSLVWNFAASHRWKLFKDKVVEGDLVMIKENAAQEKQDEVDIDGEVVIHASIDDSATTRDEMFPRARPLTAEEAASGDYSIFDVVLPQPGYDIIYPKNEMTDFYKTFMASEQGGGLDPFNMHRKWKDISLSGSYRKLLAMSGPECSAEAHTYFQEDQQFVLTDLDILNKKREIDIRTETNTVGLAPVIEQAGEGDVAKTAVVLKFQLGSSQYATMALRELMKGGATAYKHDFGGGK